MDMDARKRRVPSDSTWSTGQSLLISTPALQHSYRCGHQPGGSQFHCNSTWSSGRKMKRWRRKDFGVEQTWIPILALSLLPMWCRVSYLTSLSLYFLIGLTHTLQICCKSRDCMCHILAYNKYWVFLFFNLFTYCFTGHWTQGLVFARQVLYHLSHSSSPNKYCYCCYSQLTAICMLYSACPQKATNTPPPPAW
jgi:hypothetical protein